MQNPRTIEFKATYWSYEEIDEKLYIHVSGLTSNQKSVQVRIEGFTPFIYLELPLKRNGKTISWNRTMCQSVFETICEKLRHNAPLRFKMEIKYNLYFKDKMYTMALAFPTQKSIYSLNRLLSRSLNIPNVGYFRPREFIVNEHNIDPIIKYTTYRNIDLAGWLRVTEKITDEDLSIEDRKFSTADIDLYTEWDSVSRCEMDDSIVINPKYCSFDIECHSENPNAKLPDPLKRENIVFQIALVFGRLGSEEKKIYALSLFNPYDIEGAEVCRFDTEEELLYFFGKLIQKENPDIFIGYNIMKFDWDYMMKRAKEFYSFSKFMNFSRLQGKFAEEKVGRWSSAAYGQQVFNYPDDSGRVNVDVLLEIERNFKLPHYSLNIVSEFFLGDTKEDVSPRQIFMVVDLCLKILPLVKGVSVNLSTLRKIRIMIEDIMPKRKTHGVIRELRRKLLHSGPDKIEGLLRWAITIILEYCKKDTILPIKLMGELKLWTTMEQMSNVMHVPMSYLHTRGQQIKVVSQVYREAIKNNIIIPPSTNKVDNTQAYEGAVVFVAVPGDYEDVATLDFASLYPTTMLAYNICPTTFIRKKEDKTNCHKIELNSHSGCPHDPQKRKKKKEDIICNDSVYFFRKVTYSIGEKGIVQRKNEGLLPCLERNLLSSRKIVKKEMFATDAKLKMHKGKATDRDISYYKKQGMEIIELGSLSEHTLKLLEVLYNVLNAKQISIKTVANSVYGSLAARTGFIPFIPGAASITAMGRKLIMAAIDRIIKEWPGSKLIYGDTDSAMFVFPGATLEEKFSIARKAAAVATHYLKCSIIGVDEEYKVTNLNTGEKRRLDKVKYINENTKVTCLKTGKKKPLRKIKNVENVQEQPLVENYLFFSGLNHVEKIKVLEYENTPIDLEFESLYKRFLQLTKKRYVAYAVNEDGEVIDVIKKGVVIKRRDNCQYLRDTYKKVIFAILDKKSEEDVMNILYDRITALFTRQIPDSHLIIYVGVKSVMNYAKRKEKGDKRNKEIEYFLDKNDKPIDQVIGPDDPRLVYPNYPQVLLSLKMLNRGTIIPPNTRLEFLYLENPEAQHQGEKAEDFTYYKENKEIENFRPDFLHYLEKQLMKPITELLTVGFPKPIIVYEKPEDAYTRILHRENISEHHRRKILSVKKFIKERPEPIKDTIGWNAVKKVYPKSWVRKWQKSIAEECYSPPDEKTSYTFRNKEAQIEFILKKRYSSELVDICEKIKARNILDKLYRQYGLKKRPCKRPTQTGLKLRPNTKIVLTKPVEEFPIGTYGKIVSREDISAKVSRFNILISETIIKDVPRDFISTFYIRDGKIMKDILIARTHYRKLVLHLQHLFSNEFLYLSESEN